MGIMQAGREGGRQAEEGIQKPRRRRVRHSPPPLSLCEKALRISLACVHTRTAVAAARAHVCAISSMQCGLPGFPDGPLSSPLSPFSIQDLINAQIQFLWSFQAKDIVSLILQWEWKGEGAFEDRVDFTRSFFGTAATQRSSYIVTMEILALIFVLFKSAC